MVMTIDDDIRLDPATSGEGAIVPEGRYTMHLTRLEKAPPSDFNPEAGPRIKWVFGLYDQQGERFRFNGEDYEFFRTTSTKNSPRAFARQYTEALLGRRLNDGEVPPLRTLVGRKMSGLISYGPSDVDPTKEVLKLSSLRPVADQAAPEPQQPAAPKPAPGQIAADASDEDIDRALAISKLGKKLDRARRKKLPTLKTFEDAYAVIDEATLESIENITDNLDQALDAMDD